MNSSRNGMNVVWRIIVVEQQRSNDCFSLAQFAPSLSLFTGDVHDSLPFVLPLALPWRLHESVRWQRPGHAALGPGIQVSVFLSHKTLLSDPPHCCDLKLHLLSSEQQIRPLHQDHRAAWRREAEALLPVSHWQVLPWNTEVVKETRQKCFVARNQLIQTMITIM